MTPRTLPEERAADRQSSAPWGCRQFRMQTASRGNDDVPSGLRRAPLATSWRAQAPLRGARTSGAPDEVPVRDQEERGRGSGNRMPEPCSGGGAIVPPATSAPAPPVGVEPTPGVPQPPEPGSPARPKRPAAPLPTLWVPLRDANPTDRSSTPAARGAPSERCGGAGFRITGLQSAQTG